jgi:hypothetical protein
MKEVKTMQELGTNLTDTLSPVTKANFKKWHNDGNFLLLAGGNGVLEVTLSRLNNMAVDYKSMGRQTAVPTVDGKQFSVYMFSNGVEEFVLVVDNMTASDYSQEYFKTNGKQHITVYVIAD